MSKPATLNSAGPGLTDECLVALQSLKDQENAGSGETAVRDPLYVFAVSDNLTAAMTDEVVDFVN